MPEGRISVVIPIYNRQGYIVETLHSIEHQVMPPHEVLIINDHSTDRSVDAVRGYAADSGLTIRIIDNTRRKGVSGALNCGIEQAKGEFIAFQDSDDLWAPGHLAQLYEGMRRYREAHVAFSAIEVFGDATETSEKAASFRESVARCLAAAFIRRSESHWFSGAKLLQALLLWGVPFRCQASLVRRLFLDRCHLQFDEDVAYTQDSQFMTLASYYTPFLYVDNVGLRLRRHRENERERQYEDVASSSYEIRARKMEWFFADKELSGEEKKALKKRIVALRAGAMSLRARRTSLPKKIMESAAFLLKAPSVQGIKAVVRLALTGGHGGGR